MNAKLFSLVATLMLSNVVWAGQPLPTSQIQQIQPPPQLPQMAPQITVQPSNAASTASDTTQIKVDTLHIVGTRQFSEATLLALTGFKPWVLLGTGSD